MIADDIDLLTKLKESAIGDVGPFLNDDLSPRGHDDDIVDEIKLDLSELGLRKCAANNPTACAMVYGFLVEHIFEILFGVSVKNTHNLVSKPVNNPFEPKGVCNYVLSFLTTK